MTAEGVKFQTNAHIGVNVEVEDLRSRFDAILLTGGACHARDIGVPGRELKGIHLAMEFLTQSNRRCEGDEIAQSQAISAKDKHVVILGGGDTGADCIGTSHRQGAKSVTSLEIMPRPPERRAENNPWPEWPLIYRTASAHEEGGERLYAVSTKRFIGDADGNVTGLELVKVEMRKDGEGRLRFEEVPNSLYTIPADRVFLAMGFVGPERPGMLEQLGVRLTERGNVARDANWMTSVPGVFTAGDMQRGQSLIVWAIAEGRSAAAGVDRYLMGSTDLPAPLP
jgi:glutamate synthase (NADPH/NADH) small chain